MATQWKPHIYESGGFYSFFPLTSGYTIPHKNTLFFAWASPWQLRTLFEIKGASSATRNNQTIFFAQ